MKPFTIELRLVEVDIGGYLLDVCTRVTIADQGIGAYEFWGMKGYDTHVGIDEIQILEASYADGQEDLPKIPAKEFLESADNEEELYKRATEAWESHQVNSYREVM